MTVQELIEALNKVEDKSLPIYYYYYGDFGDFFDIDEIEEHENSDVALFKEL